MIYTELLFLTSKYVRTLYTVTNPYVTNKLNKIKSREYRLQSYVGYSLLGKILFERFNIDINRTVITENKYGKPYFPKNNIKFNISHSNNVVACSVSESDVGVDVEKISDIREKILKLYTHLEREQIHTPEDFYKLWTLKESAVKFIGKGISDIKRHEFTLRPEITCISEQVPQNVKHKVFIIEDYILSISSEDTIDEPVIIR